MRAFLFLLLCCVAARVVAAAPSTILVLGDSLSAAHNIPIDAGWPHLLEARLETTLCIRCKEDQERMEKDYG